MSFGAPVASTSHSGTGTSVPIDSRGAAFFVIAISFITTSPPTSITDSEGKTWLPLTQRDSGLNASSQMWYAIGGTTSPTHTFTVLGSLFTSFNVVCFPSSSAAAFESESGNGQIGGTTIQPGALTPAVADELVVTSIALGVGSGTPTIDSGFTIQEFAPVGSDFGSAIAYLLQSAPLTVDPTWTLSSSQSAVEMATFSPGGGGVPVPVLASNLYRQMR